MPIDGAQSVMGQLQHSQPVAHVTQDSFLMTITDEICLLFMRFLSYPHDQAKQRDEPDGAPEGCSREKA